MTGPEAALGGAGELSGTQCVRCGAVGTHYLTCPDLRLPPGYRLGEARGSDKHGEALDRGESAMRDTWT